MDIRFRPVTKDDMLYMDDKIDPQKAYFKKKKRPFLFVVDGDGQTHGILGRKEYSVGTQHALSAGAACNRNFTHLVSTTKEHDYAAASEMLNTSYFHYLPLLSPDMRPLGFFYYVSSLLGYERALLNLDQLIGDRTGIYFLGNSYYAKLVYKKGHNKKPDMANPEKYGEKIKWTGLYDRDPIYIRLTDKYAVREHVAQLIGEEYLVPSLGVWDSFDDIDFSSLPESFVLKCTHDSDSVVLCPDKKKFDMANARKKINGCMKVNYGKKTRLWSYIDIRPRIVAEQYLTDPAQPELLDYKFFCFDGEPTLMYVASNRFSQLCFDFFDMEFTHLPLRFAYPQAAVPPEKPSTFDEMVALARVLAKGLRHVRMDFYSINDHVYFGEYTFYHYGGNGLFFPDEWDYRLGSLFRLPSF